MEAAHWTLHFVSLAVILGMGCAIRGYEARRIRLLAGLERRRDGVDWEQGMNQTSVSGHAPR